MICELPLKNRRYEETFKQSITTGNDRLRSLWPLGGRILHL